MLRYILHRQHFRHSVPMLPSALWMAAIARKDERTLRQLTGRGYNYRWAQHLIRCVLAGFADTSTLGSADATEAEAGVNRYILTRWLVRPRCPPPSFLVQTLTDG